MTGIARVYPIVDSAAWVERLVCLGITMVQLRIKGRDAAALRSEAVAASAICARHGATLVLNDYWQLALDLGIGFVHLGQEDLNDADLGALRAAGLRLGISTHDPAELDRALGIAPDYIALGPIWPTTLKKMPWAPQGVARVAEWKVRLGAVPLVAIGGITLERAAACWDAGADSVSFVSDIAGHADPESRIAAWVAAAR